jgi:hypothetical protein
MLYGSIVVSNMVLKFVALLSLFEGYEVTLDVEFNEFKEENNIIYTIYGYLINGILMTPTSPTPGFDIMNT